MADLHINKKRGWEAKWQEAEDDIIRKYYPKNGSKSVQEYLKNRSVKSIQTRAQKLNVHYLQYNRDYFQDIDSAEKAYWLGFIYADGYVTTGDRWGVELCYADINHLKNLLSALKYNGNIKIRERNGNKTCYFLIKNKKMTNDLVSKGVVLNKTYCLEFPDTTILKKELYPHFIRGFFDGDGCVCYTYKDRVRKDRNNKVYKRFSKYISFVCKSENFIDACLNELKDNDIHLYKTINKRDDLPTIYASALDEIQKFYNYIYNDSNPKIRLKRKFDKFNEIFSHYQQ